MKLSVELSGNEHHVEFRREGSRLTVHIDERLYDAEVQELSATHYVLLVDGKVFDCRVTGARNSPSVVTVGAETFEVSITDPKRLGSGAGATAHSDHSARIVAPMPGKVVRVLVELGEQVETGAGVIVVEAMKMQNEMKSPIAGVVGAISVEVGATVNAGDVLAVVEEFSR